MSAAQGGQERRFTVLQMATLVGRRMMLTYDDLRFEVEILDVRQRFGKIDVEVTPVAGRGRTWKSLRMTALLGGDDLRELVTEQDAGDDHKEADDE